MHPVAAHAGRQTPAVEFDLVLQVDAAALGQAVLVSQQGAWTTDRLVIIRCIDVDRRRRPGGVKHRTVEPGVIPASQQGVLQFASGETADHASVAAHRLHILVYPNGITLHHPVGDRAVGLQVLVGGVQLAVAQILLQAERVVEGVLELVAEGPLTLAELVEVLIALPEIGEAVTVVIEHRRGGGLALLILRQQGQAGGRIDLPAQRGRQHAHVIVQLFDVVVGVTIDADGSKQHIARLVQLAANIELPLLVIVITGLDFHLILRLQTGPLAHPVDHAAGADLPVQHRSRALEHLDAFQGVGLRAVDRQPAVVGLAQTVEEVSGHGRVEAADVDLIEARIEPRAAGTHASAVGHGVFDAVDLAIGDLPGGDNADALRGLQNRQIGLGRGAGIAGEIPRKRRKGALRRRGLDGHRL